MPWLVRMRWDNLLFAHWRIDADVMRARLPDIPGLELDLFDGVGWLGVVPFTMADVAIRGVPALPSLRSFPEVNVRTYVRYRGRAGVWFLSLDAASRLMVWAGRTIFHVPYHLAAMRSLHTGDAIEFSSKRAGAGPQAPRFGARYRPRGPGTHPPTDSFHAWSTDRTRVYSMRGSRRLWHADVAHGPWSLRAVDADLDAHELGAALGLTLPDEPPRVAFSERLDVTGGLPAAIARVVSQHQDHA